MSDLISRSALIAEFERIYEAHYKCTVYQFIHDIFKAMFRRLKNAPAVDAVEVCRCKDCEHWNTEEKSFYGTKCRCERFSLVGYSENYTLPSDFCSYGERREDG